MTLVQMLRTDRDALLCDLAETYQVYSFDQVPVATLAILASGLRENSRIKTKLSGYRYPFDELLQMREVDLLSLLLWTQTKNAQKGHNRPNLLLDEMLKKEEDQPMVFTTPEDFDKKWKQLGGGGHGN